MLLNIIKNLQCAPIPKKKIIWNIQWAQKHYAPVPLDSHSNTFIEEIYKAWAANPGNVHASWDSYFRSSAQDAPELSPKPQQLAPHRRHEGGGVPSYLPALSAAGGAGGGGGGGGALDKATERLIDNHLAVQGIIRSYQARGHLVANLDPLGIMYSDRKTTLTDVLGAPPEKITRQHALDQSAMESEYKLPQTTFIGGNKAKLPLREIFRRLDLAYCHHIGTEFMHINDMDQLNWIRKRLETPGCMEKSAELKKRTLKRLTRATSFESFTAKKWSSEKRFGLEGCEVLIPAVKYVIDKSTECGVESIHIGMPHRGRINLLANVCRKPLGKIFTRFVSLEAEDTGAGDIKYHLGTCAERLNRATNKNIKISILANPSHLEAVNAIAEGKARADQFYRGDSEGKKVMTMVFHGDAAFAGQGVVYETMGLSGLPQYSTHGTIHFVVNNQVGFTTDPRFHRSSPYCSDVARVVNAPIFHVNSDDPESVMHVCEMAAEYRATFHHDVVIDIVCYRRNGHNEAEEPAFTQPLMYTKIRKQKPVVQKYAEQLIKDKVCTAEEVKEINDKYNKILEEAYEKAQKKTTIKNKDWIDSPWSGFFEGRDPLKMKKTGVSEETLNHIGKRFSSAPPPAADFVIHKGLERVFKQRMDNVKARMVDWAMAEAMAFGSLVKKGFHVRLSGQDVERGTFSHRHHVLHHQTVDKATYRPLSNLYPDQAVYSVTNSSLSEYAVLGFELGYSMYNPNALVLWEAQFGDFSNVAQCMIDQFISAGEAKWIRQSGLVMLLPHGLEGSGPEHSSARLERFIQMSTDNPDNLPPEDEHFGLRQLKETNWIIAQPTAPSNYFHILRRQVLLPFRKPLVLMTPKATLRHPDAKSSFDEMLEQTEFRRVIPESGEASKTPGDVKKLIFCGGKVFYDINTARKETNLHKEVAIARIEQFTPFPYDLVKMELAKYAKAKVIWVQEEHKNQGCWNWIQPRFQKVLGGREITYVGRPISAPPATGIKIVHLNEIKKMKAEAMQL